MAPYQLTWITENLAVGYAPMSYAELDAIRAQGIDAIVNLCGEFCDLHEIEEKSGFEVHFLPIPDESAPDMEEMEKALEWLDEAIYLGKKVLIHCRHGIGRTGTFVSAYMLRRGLGLKVTEKKLSHTRATPTNYAQWRLLKKYGKKSGTLTIREPSLESRNVVDLSDFFAEYEAMVQDVEEKVRESERNTGEHCRCGADSDACCRRYFELKLIEAIYLNNKINKSISSAGRQEVIARSAQIFQRLRTIAASAGPAGGDEGVDEIYARKNLICPLNVEGKCMLYAHRPIRCRTWGLPDNTIDAGLVEDVLSNISRSIFFALSGVFPEKGDLLFSSPDTFSGRFIQIYFHYLASL